MGLASVFLLFVRAILLRLLQCLQIFVIDLFFNPGSNTRSKIASFRFFITDLICVSCFVLIFCIDILTFFFGATNGATRETK